MRSPLEFIFLLLIKGCLPCAVNEDQQPLETYLLNKMAQSAMASEALPNPNVLLALRLAQDHSLNIERRLLKKLSKDAIDRMKNVKTFSSGQVALYALAHQAACSNPRRVSDENVLLDLVSLLEQKFDMEMKNINNSNNPLTNYYQLGLSILALCQLQGTFSPSQIADLFSPDEKKYYLSGQFSVDTAALAILAQICVQNTMNDAALVKENRTISANVQWLLKKMLEHKSNRGIIGNMYSTGEAMQALFVADKYLVPGSWNCTQTLATVLSEIPKGTFDNPMAAAQLLPSLWGRTYLDVNRFNCSKDKGDHFTYFALQQIMPFASQRSITVMYTVTDSYSNRFSESTTVTVPESSVFFRVMEAAQEKDPKKFRFTYEQSQWGPYITSVQDLRADNENCIYWKLLSGKTPLSKGAGEYVVSDGESLLVKFTT
ncbi:transcobalamin-1 isoform X1 [Anolis carolinensis]|uniref:transcobalamin-1 isoform X1 n=2 Tax=Anolis carolinensis TaxID=28377 RepID=UPI002F2B323E